MKTFIAVLFLFLGIIPGGAAEAQVTRAINQTVGTWHAPQEAQQRGLPARIVINRFSGAVVGGRNCKWKSESRTKNWGAWSETSLAAVNECPNMQEIVVTATNDKFTQDEVRVEFGDGPAYRYASEKFLREQRQARESPPQRWGQ